MRTARNVSDTLRAQLREAELQGLVTAVATDMQTLPGKGPSWVTFVIVKSIGDTERVADALRRNGYADVFTHERSVRIVQGM